MLTGGSRIICITYQWPMFPGLDMYYTQPIITAGHDLDDLSVNDLSVDNVSEV